ARGIAQRSEPRFAKPSERAKRDPPAMRKTGYCSTASAPMHGDLKRLQRQTANVLPLYITSIVAIF
ncbi:MAG: hypothetical protein M3142_13930, partial [Bacteroidota bacterium]|nr:hypothetical protein [Bacteroidota bacterium]